MIENEEQSISKLWISDTHTKKKWWKWNSNYFNKKMHVQETTVIQTATILKMLV